MTNLFGINLIVYLLINAILFLGWFWLLKNKFKLDNGLNFVLTFIFGHIQILLSSMFLGLVVHRLYAAELFALNLILSIILLYLARFRFSQFREFTKETRWQIIPKKRPSIAVLAFLFVTFVLIINLLGLIVLFGPTSWDDYNYHLQFVADIMRSGMIRYFETTHMFTISYPHNIEIFNLWQVIFFRNDFLAELVNFNFLVFGGVSVYLLCRQLKSSKKLALLSSLLIFAIPVLLMTAKSTKVDVVIWTLFPAIMYLILRLNKENLFKKSGYLIIAGVFCTLGLIFGTKSSAFIYLLIIYLAFIYRFISEGRSHKQFFRKLIITHIFLFFAFLLLGSFWYFRSWYYFGNPLFPVAFRLLGHEFPGSWQGLDFASDQPQIQSRDFFSRLIYAWEERQSWFGVFYIVDSKISGTGPLWYVILFPAYVIAVAAAAIKKNKDLFLTLIPAVVILILIPGNWISHYTGFICIFGLVAFNYLLNFIVTGKFQRLFVLLMTFLIFAYSFVLTADSSYFLPLLSLKRLAHLNEDAPTSVKYRQLNLYIDEHILRDETVATGPVWFVYTLYSSDFRNDVIYLPMTSAGEEDWFARIDAANPRYFVAMKGSAEDLVAEKNPKLLTKILTDDDGPTFLYSYNRYRH